MRQLLSKLIFNLILLSSSAFASDSVINSCMDAQAQWEQLTQMPLKAGAKVSEIANWHRKKDEVAKCLAHDTFQNFLNQNQKISYRLLIPDTLDQSFFLTELQKEAVDQTLEFFKMSGSSEAIKFRNLILARSTRSGLGFSMTESGDAIEDRPAGFIRAQGHIIMNYAVMNRDDWLFLFIHEFSHFVDPTLESSVLEAAKFSSEHADFLPRLLKEIPTMTSLSDLSPEEYVNLDLYLKLSLERGWIAEIRAWSNTLEIYSSLKNTHLMNGVAWADEVMLQKNPAESWTNFFSHYLSSRFQYPNNPIYKNPLLLERSHQIEQQILKSL